MFDIQKYSFVGELISIDSNCALCFEAAVEIMFLIAVIPFCFKILRCLIEILKEFILFLKEKRKGLNNNEKV